MSRPAPPDLEFGSPPCSICDAETEAGGDGFACYNCDAYWDETGQSGEWLNPEYKQCQSTTYNSWSKATHRCILAATHTGGHEVGHWHCGWSDSTAVPTPDDAS